MSPSDAEELSGVRRRASHILDRAASILPTVRARLFALVLVALVPALVILVYDEWLARDRGFAALTDLSTRVVRLLQREMDDRITRGAHRLAVLAADPDVIALTPAATRKLVDALREDRLYNNLLIADGTTGDVRASAVPLDHKANVRELLAFERARRTLDFATGAFLPEPATHEAWSQRRAPRRERGRHSDVHRVREHRPRLGVRVHRTFRPSAEHRPDRSRRSGRRPVSLGGSGEVRREARGRVGDGARHVHKTFGALPASTASSGCTSPSRWSFADSIRAPASRSGSLWLPIAPP